VENFVLNNPTTVFFGRKTEEKVGKITAGYSKNILLHHYGVDILKMIGVYDPVIKSLNDAGVKFTELTGVKPNPRISLVREGIEICRKNQIDFILAVGGGSVIDSAKAIAFGVPYNGDVWDLFARKARVQQTLPTGCILTLPGTGSETSLSCIVTNDETNFKGSVDTDVIRPKFAIMDPQLTVSLPSFQTMCGTFDAMSHVIERYFTDVPNVAVTDFQCESLMKAIIHIGPLQLIDPQNYDYRAEIMWASKLAHDGSLGVGRISDWISHGIGHQISGASDLTHGASIAIIMPAWMKYIYQQHVDRFYKFAVNVFGVEPTAMNREQTAYEGIIRFETFLKRIGLPTRLSEAKLDASIIPQVSKWFKDGFPGRFHPLTQEDIENILKLAL
jgi:alcohol dehydrogenase YqhD (iron-dependent ADH family)